MQEKVQWIRTRHLMLTIWFLIPHSCLVLMTQMRTIWRHKKLITIYVTEQNSMNNFINPFLSNHSSIFKFKNIFFKFNTSSVARFTNYKKHIFIDAHDVRPSQSVLAKVNKLIYLPLSRTHVFIFISLHHFVTDKHREQMLLAWIMITSN